MKKRPIELTSTQRDYLAALVLKGSQAVRVYQRAPALLNLDAGKSRQAVSEQVGVSYVSVSKWRNAFQKERLSMLFDQQRPGRPLEIDGQQRAKLTALACSQPPEGHSRWPLRLLADKVVEQGYCEHLSHV